MFEGASSFNGQKKLLRALVPVIDNERFERASSFNGQRERFERASSFNIQSKVWESQLLLCTKIDVRRLVSLRDIAPCEMKVA